MQADEDFLEECIEDGVNASAHLDWGFHVPAVEVRERLSDLVGNVFHAAVNFDVSVPLFLFFGRRFRLAPGWVKTGEVAGSSVHGCTEGGDDDRTIGCCALVLGWGFGWIW